MKAVEAALHDDNWLKAQFVELLPREGSLLLETDEAVMAARQLALESKVKEAGQKMAWGQGKGRWGGRQDESEPPPLQLSLQGGEGKERRKKEGGEGKEGEEVSPAAAEKAASSTEARPRSLLKKEAKYERNGGDLPEDNPPMIPCMGTVEKKERTSRRRRP